MLKKVVFILEDEKAAADVEALSDELTAYGITVCIIGAAHWNRTNKLIKYFNQMNILEEIGTEETGTKKPGTKKPGTLYITDNPVYHKFLADNKLPVIVYLHDGNKELNFSYAEYAIENIEEIEYESLELGYLRLTGQPWTILETNRCIVRESTVEDVDSFYEIYKEPSITKYMENLYQDRAEEAAYIQDYIKKVYSFYGYGMWTILEKSSHKVIGRAGINWREGYDIPELGFVIAVPFQRKGFAYEVCDAILQYGNKELGFNAFQVLIMEGNEISKSLCEKLGFKYEETIEYDGAVYFRMVLRI